MTQRHLLFCDVCGASSERRIVLFRKKYGQTLCSKHVEQMRRHGKITDVSERSCFDRNAYSISGDCALIDLFNRSGDRFQTIVDSRFLDDIIQRKWRPIRKCQKIYVGTIANDKEVGRTTYLHRVIMKLGGEKIEGMEVDHINGNSLDNRLENLRAVTREEQMMNLSPKTGGEVPVRGVSADKRKCKYIVDFSHEKKRLYLKHFDSVEVAVYARYLLEKFFIGEMSLTQSLPRMIPYINKISEEKKKEIENYILLKIQGETII